MKLAEGLPLSVGESDFLSATSVFVRELSGVVSGAEGTGADYLLERTRTLRHVGGYFTAEQHAEIRTFPNASTLSSSSVVLSSLSPSARAGFD